MRKVNQTTLIEVSIMWNEIKELVSSIEFVLDIEFDGDFNSIIELKEFAVANLPNPEAVKIIELLDKHSEVESTLTDDETKEVWRMLKDRHLNPKGEFDKQGRFYLKDSELVNVRTPSARYPYSQMTAGRSSKFVKAVAQKYNCKSKEELLKRFEVA